jgi:transcriptional regulator with XRE-family HTH domain
MTNATPTNRLTELREQAEMSPAGLADLVGVAETQVRRWERGDVLIPTKYLSTLTDLLSVTADHLLGLDRESTPTTKAAA